MNSKVVALGLAAAFLLAGCGKNSSNSGAKSGASKTEVKVGVLKNVKETATIQPGSGFIERNPDGTIAGYPDGTKLSLALSGTLNGRISGATLSATYASRVGDAAVFYTPAHLPILYLSSGIAFPCFSGDTIPQLKATGNTSSDAFLQAWVSKEFTYRNDTVRHDLCAKLK